ncbi:MAG: hypothetical protein ACI4OY_08285, partial [Aristaeellaceae bacterium]
MSLQLNLTDFPGTDDRERFAAALAKAKEHPGSTLLVPPGVYRITTPLARQTMRDAISGCYGENPEDVMFRPDFPFSVGISLSGHEGTTLLAYGVRLMVEGFMEVLSLDHCRGVTVHGLTIDHVRKPYSRGVIESYDVEDAAARTGHILVRFDDGFPVDEHTIMPRLCAYDLRTHCFNLDMKLTGRQYLGCQRYCLHMRSMPETDLTGQELYIWHTFHFRPAILIEEARDVILEDVTIHSQPGMGIVGHRSENILLERLRVVPSHGEHMSTNTDATHFTSCKGDLTFHDCAFEGHGDDATNVHTFYHDVEPLGGCSYRGSVGVRTHSLTLDYPDPGDEMELVDKASLTLRGTCRVKAAQPDASGSFYVAELDAPLPEDTAENCYLADVTRAPRLRFIHCTAENHWARSVLIKTRHALVEDCTFRGSALQAIHVAAEGWWHEGVACADVTIRGNRFVDCGVSGHAEVGGVRVEMAVERPAG